MLTPPDTPHSLPLPDDHMEKASLDSRGSTEEASASVSSGEVATGTLIDLAGMTLLNIIIAIYIKPGVEWCLLH